MHLSLLHLKLLFLFQLIANSNYEQSTSIMVRIDGLKSDQGKCLVYLYNASKGSPTDSKRAIAAANAIIDGKACNIEFKAVAPGNYAIAVIHDENGNGKLDTNFIGIPKEGIGTSNNAKGSFGPPSFRDSTFIVNDEPISLSITVTYL